MSCVDETLLIEERMDRVLTQYRESPNLLFMLRTYLGQVTKVFSAICDMPSFFDINTAVGDQLTLIGKRMGFPRCHCACDVQPVFGFACVGELDRPVTGFCESSTWADCDSGGIVDICINDDDLYRKFLISRSYQMQQRFSSNDLTLALQAFFGPTARILDSGRNEVVLAPLRELTEAEMGVLTLIPRALPIAPGVVTRWHFGSFPIFGFGDGWGGFCEEWKPDGLPLITESGKKITTEDGTPIITGPLTRDSDWLCRLDLKPYSC